MKFIPRTRDYIVLDWSKVNFAGLDIIQDQSEKTEKKTKLSKKGNSHIRRIYY